MDTNVLVYAQRREARLHHQAAALIFRDRDFALFSEPRVQEPFDT